MKVVKKVRAYLVLIGVMLILAACGNESKVSKSAEDYSGNYYNAVAEELRKDGFKNVQTVAVEDITSDSDIADGSIASVSIDGNSSFAAKEKFASDAEVIITYHKIPTAIIPINADDIQMYPFTSINKMLTESGFSNVTMSEVYDIDPDTTASEYVNEVTIDGSDSFKKGETMVFDAPVSIVVHYPYEKYTVKLAIDFIGNWIFNTYDVDVYIDETKLEQLAHGTDGAIETRIQDGEHTISFVDHDDRSIKGTTPLNVTSDVEAGYQISCHTDYVDVTEQYLDYQYELADDEVKVMNSHYGFTDRNYKEVVTELEELGFINIKTVPQYDIVWGITPENSVADVSIDGSNNYGRGDVFKNDVEVKVSYHLKEEDNPANKTETTTASSAASSTDASAKSTEGAASADTTNQDATKEEQKSSSESDREFSYTTNGRDTYKAGNSGVYAYRSRGGTYYTYYIVDFDAGYVYWFQDGNGDGTYRQADIISGDLNNGLRITFNAAGSSWSENLSFRWSKQPDHLVMTDLSDPNHPWQFDYYNTDLDDALDIMSERTLQGP